MKQWRIFLCLILLCCMLTACAAKPSVEEPQLPTEQKATPTLPAVTITPEPSASPELLRENPVHGFLQDYRKACASFLQAADTVHTGSPEAYENVLRLSQHEIRLQRLLGAAESLAYVGEGGFSGSFFGTHAGQGDVWKTPDGYSLRCILQDGSRIEGELSLNRLTAVWSGEETILGMCAITFEENGWSAALYMDESWDFLRADANRLTYAKEPDAVRYDQRQAAVALTEYPVRDWSFTHLQVTTDEVRMVQPE